MKIWGYVLIVLNIGASVAFIHFGVQVWKARTEWQYAQLKQDLVNRGLPLEGPAKPPEDLEEDHVPFEFQFGPTTLESISKRQLAKLIPSGGEPLGAKAGEVVANQTDEVKRVEKKIFAELDAAKQPQKRAQLLVLLLNLSTGMGREGTYALLRDFPDDRRRSTARRELAFLGRTAPQVAALLAMNGVGEAQSGFAPNVAPAEKSKRIRVGRQALVSWAMSEIPQAVPEPLTKPNAPRLEEGEKSPASVDRDRLTEILAVIKKEMESATPGNEALEAGKQALLGLLDGKDPIQSETGKALIPFIAQIATNQLDSEAKIAEAKQKLLELLLARATTEAEKKSLTATVELMAPANPDAVDKEKMNQGIDTAALELLRAYFEAAEAKPSTDLPPDDAQARAKLAALKPIRDPGQKRLDIAHLLYHLDANLGVSKPIADQWTATFAPGGPKAEEAAAEGAPKPKPVDDATRRTLWHQRVVAIVGLEGYVPVVEAQASELNGIYQRLQSRILEEQNLFETEYQHEVLEAVALAIQLDIRQAAVKAQEQNLADHTRQLAVREVEKKELENRLAAATATAKTALQNLDAKTGELFQITKQLGEAQDALVGLERQLHELELRPTEGKKN